MLNSISKRFQKTGTGTLTVAAPGAGRYNMVKSIAAYSSATASIAICSPSSTTVIWGGAVTKTALANCLVHDFSEGAEPKGNENKPIYIKCSAGTYRLSVTGVVGG